jgi:hypothetical protein
LTNLRFDGSSIEEVWIRTGEETGNIAEHEIAELISSNEIVFD